METILYVLNKKAGARNLDKYQSDGGDERWQKVKQFLDEKKCQYVFVDVSVENELSSFDGDEKETYFTKTTYRMMASMTSSKKKLRNARAYNISHHGRKMRRVHGQFCAARHRAEASTAIHTDFKDVYPRGGGILERPT